MLMRFQAIANLILNLPNSYVKYRQLFHTERLVAVLRTNDFGSFSKTPTDESENT